MVLCQVEGCTCFHHRLLDCIEQGINDEAQLLLKEIEKPCDTVDSSGKSLMHTSVQYGNEVMVQHLIEKGYKVDFEDHSGETPLMLAIKSNNVTIAEVFFKNNADVFIMNSKGVSTLEMFLYSHRLWHISNDKNRKIISEMFVERINNDFIVKKDAVVKSLLNANNVAKLVLIVYGSIELTEFILVNDYDINFREPKHGNSAFDCALALAKLEKAKYLIQLGASVNLINWHGRTLSYYYQEECEKLDKNSELLKSILNCGADLNVCDREGDTGIECLLSFGNKDTVGTIVQSGIDWVSNIISNLRGPFHPMIKNSKIKITDMIDLGITYNVIHEHDKKTCDALFTAASYAQLHKFEFLLKTGAGKYSTKSELGCALTNLTTNHWCLFDDAATITEHLLQCGADPQYRYYRDEYTLIEKLLVGPYKEATPVKIILAHLVLLEVIDKSTISEDTRNVIQANPISKTHFYLCKKTLEDLKRVFVYGTVSLFEFITKSEDKIIPYTRNQELVEAFTTAIENVSHLEPYYVSTFKKKFAKAVDRKDLEDKTAAAVENLTGFCMVRNYIIVRKITDYLNCQDMNALCQI